MGFAGVRRALTRANGRGFLRARTNSRSLQKSVVRVRANANGRSLQKFTVRVRARGRRKPSESLLRVRA